MSRAIHTSVLLSTGFCAVLAGCAAPSAATKSNDAPRPIDVAQIKHPDGETPAWWFRAGVAAAVRGSLEQNVLFHVMAQANEPIRKQLCALGGCNAGSVPVELPAYAKLREPAAAPR